MNYTVDMSIGICDCKSGCDGSSCAHQYFFWAKNISSGINFAPVFNKEDRQHFAKIAFGTALPLSFYEVLHSAPEPVLNDDEQLSQTAELATVCFFRAFSNNDLLNSIFFISVIKILLSKFFICGEKKD